MTVTPWGDVRQLRSKRLPPGPGKGRGLAARRQRERLFAAMVTAVAESGYSATRVADVIELAGVSRGTFYRDFDNLLDCFLQTLEAIVAGAEVAMVAELERDGPWDGRLRGSFATLIDLVIAQPAAARLCLVESYAAGPDAVARVDRMARGVGRRVLAVGEESPERAGMPRDVARAVLGGLRKVIQTRLYSGREHELPVLAPALMDWALAYRTPPEPLRRPRPPVPERQPPASGLDDPRQRILDSLEAIVARKGYAETTINEIASTAAISLTTFYARFESKDAAFLAAVDDAALRLFEVALPAYRQAGDWPHGVRDAIETLLTYLSHQPTTAHLAAQAVWTGGPDALVRLDEGMAGFQALLVEGLRRRSSSSGLTAEAISSSILALTYDSIVRGEAEDLWELAPPASFVALSPAIGAIEACTVVNER